MPGTFSGDGSVIWTVEGNNVREASSILLPPKKGRPRRVVQRGIDETDPGEYFTIEIKAPREEDERRMFVEALRRQLDAVSQGRTLKVRLPIEDKRRNGGAATREQIKIAWPSAKRVTSASAS